MLDYFVTCERGAAAIAPAKPQLSGSAVKKTDLLCNRREDHGGIRRRLQIGGERQRQNIGQDRRM
jgi:hypothetical protein